MSVLNTASDGLFNVVIVIYRTIAALGPMTKERLIALCAASSDDNGNCARQTLRRWTELGLFADDDDVVRIDDEHLPPPGDPKRLAKATASLSGLIRRVAFREANNQRFWDSEGNRSADLSRGLAWLCAQDIYAVNLGSHPSVQQLELVQVADPDRRMVQNDVRWNGLRSWARYLGFLWEAEDRIVDPTCALRQDLPLIFGATRELAAPEFLDRIKEILPVLDGGRYRLAIEEVLNPAYWHRPENPDFLSTSLSRALFRLDAEGSLTLESRADARDSRSLQGRDRHEWRRFTHVRWELAA